MVRMKWEQGQHKKNLKGRSVKENWYETKWKAKGEKQVKYQEQDTETKNKFRSLVVINPNFQRGF